MMRTFLYSLFLSPPLLIAQEIIPSEGEQLNFIQVLFQTPQIKDAETYTFIVEPISNGQTHSAIVQEDSTHVTIINALKFGSNYQWKVIAKDVHGTELKTSEFHHFSIGKSLVIDSSQYRFVVRKHDTEKVAGGVLFLDYANVAIDRTGKPVWYLPNIGKDLRTERMRDLEMTDRGTLTLLSAKLGLEFDLRGNILWKTPSDGKIAGGTEEYYHHELTRLQSGNYLVLCNGYEDKSLTLDDMHIDRIPLSYIVEYNADGDTVWTWHSGMYVQYEDYFKVGKKVFKGNSFGHMNSAFVDEENGLIYAGFRDLNAILVIDKESRKVIRTYGDKIPSDTTTMAVGFFKKQHAPVAFGNNEIVLFNNNIEGQTSSVVVFNEPSVDQPKCEIQWEFKCDFDSVMPGNSGRLGNVQPMTNDQFLVNMGNVARLFEVNRTNEVLWDCLPQKWNRDSSRWVPFSNYRLHYEKSLYPCYFSFAMKTNSIGEEIIQIANEGSEDDTYNLSLITSTNLSHHCQKSIPAETIRSFPLEELFKPRQLKKSTSIRIQSTKNPLLIRELPLRR